MQSWIVQQALLHHLFDEPQIPGVEHLELGLHLQVARDRGALTQIVRRRYVGAVAVAEIQAPAVDRADLGLVQAFLREIDDVPHAVFLGAEIAPGRGRVLEPVLADNDVASHAAGEIHDHIDLALADALHHLPIVAGFHAEVAGLRVADVDVDDRRAGLGRLDGGGGYLLRGDGAMRALLDLGVISRYCAGNDDVVIHGNSWDV
jgi:hypothetical protein